MKFQLTILLAAVTALAGCAGGGVSGSNAAPQTPAITEQSNLKNANSTPPSSAAIVPESSVKSLGYVAPGRSVSHVEHLTPTQQNELRGQGATSADLSQIEAENERTNAILKEEVSRKPQFFSDNKTLQTNAGTRTSQAYAPSESLTRPGVYYVTLANFSSGLPVPGHAAMVSRYTNWTIEAYGNGPAQYLGVKYHYNGWRPFVHFDARTANNTNVNQDVWAAYYAEQQVNKPYNWNFFNPRDTNSFYCSSLIWNAFRIYTGVDVVGFGWNPSYVSPYHLYITSNAHTIYRQ